ncbi:transcription termination factor Rho [Blastococcus colisei]|uniref:Transcription termination factor Rho n=1 Tax=Blastococcus colisei TaxID=1564162 RepID=A0A543PC89_9ACTN|nr:transcription termination factor Rho [Blastococcus colisei]TQN41707.1 transcription termination factor Rho [Blastococcus colisei]
MSETTDLEVTGTQDAAGPTEATAASGTTGSPRRRGNGLSGMLLPELQRLAGELGISGTGRMRKGDLVAAISARQVGGGDAPAGGAPAARVPEARGVAATSAPLEAPVSGGANGGPLTGATETPEAVRPTRTRRGASRPAGSPSADAAPAGETTEIPAAIESAAPAAPSTDDAPADGDQRTEGDRPQRSRDRGRNRGDRDGAPRDAAPRDGGNNRDGGNRDGGGARDGGNRDGGSARDGGARDGGTRDGNRGPDRGDRNDRGGRPDNRNDNRNDGRTNTNDDDDDDFEGGRGRRGRRYRDRNKRGGNSGGGRDRYDQGEPTVSEDDVLLPVAGILDVLDNYAFVRTSGYLTGPNDVYVSLSQVRRYGLRRGDAITGAVRQPREGERKDKYNALVRLDTVNGLEPDQAKNRAEFTKLTPLYPQERLRLETEPHVLTTRVLDLVMPIGKGQRALIVSPPKAGKTMVLQALANAITTNNPECHLMVVLVDERPEEVTDMQRSVKGEVIASTFDRPPADHTTVAELSIERAKRLVEMGHDVVVLLDSITRLGRAYNLAAPASGRILSGGVDSTALYPPKRFLGAARNIENGGSLTIIASALVETGSTMDTVIFEEFKGTGNAEIKLDRRLADKRVFPAVDVNASGTRKEEILMNPDELAIVIKLRRVLAALEPQQALELLLDKLKKTRNNVEFLMQIQKTTLGPTND